jgi:hypothetical protein
LWPPPTTIAPGRSKLLDVIKPSCQPALGRVAVAGVNNLFPLKAPCSRAIGPG